jgi:cytochrome P450
VPQIPELYWDPYDVDIDTDPYEIWRRMRDEAPLYRNDKYDFWALTRYHDVEAASRDTATFSSAHGTVLEFMGDAPARNVGLIFMDPPEHTRLRALVSRAFTPRRVADLEPRVRALCTEMLNAQRDASSFDYVKDFGARLPSRVISALFGVPPSDQPWVLERIDGIFHIEPGVGMVNDVSFRSGIELGEYLIGQMEDRRTNPQDDLMTALLHAQITDDDGEARTLTLEESTAFANLLISAGTETVGRLLGWAAVILAEHPDQRAELAADPSLVPNAIEELLRYEAPSPVNARWVMRPVELHGEKLEPASKVILLTGSAGRDERRFPEPDRFDIHRKIDHHVSFGHGIHFCIGAALARLEGRVALEETLKRFPTWEVDHERAVRLHTSTVRGYSSVPIEVGG